MGSTDNIERAPEHGSNLHDRFSEGLMAEPTFEQFVAKERQRLTKAREDALAKRVEIEASITAIDTELSAIDAYEAAKHGRPARRRKRCTRHSGRREEVLAAVKQHRQGITRGELLEFMSTKEKSSAQSVSNALAALKRAGTITSIDGKYKVA